jgi:hypothetical protein
MFHMMRMFLIYVLLDLYLIMYYIFKTMSE